MTVTHLLSVSLTARMLAFPVTSMPVAQQLPFMASHGQLGWGRT